MQTHYSRVGVGFFGGGGGLELIDRIYTMN